MKGGMKMNPLLIFYLFLAAFLIWILSARLFPKIGDVIQKLIDNMKDEKREDKNDEENEQ